MKVCCVKILDSLGTQQDKSSWLTVGKTYAVLSIEFDLKREWKLRLIGDGKNGVALFPLECFEIVSGAIPKNWSVSWQENGFFKIAPEAWAKAGFWERFYDQDPDAIRTFENEKSLIEHDMWNYGDNYGGQLR